ncbi:MAG TPA: hypothetical protein PK597_00300 [Oscillospiraceae bacterium]|nr:hypothetical protein [Oscillospiraceae bacterium]
MHFSKINRTGRFLLRLREAPYRGRLFRRVGLDCPRALDEELGRILRARLG